MNRQTCRTWDRCAAALLLATTLVVGAGAAQAADQQAPTVDANAPDGEVAPSWTQVQVLTPSPELIPSAIARAAMGELEALSVAVDPETGALRAPTREERAQLNEALQPRLNRSSAGLQAVTLVNGTQLLNLQGRFLSAAQVEVLPDGSRQFQCLMETEEETAVRQQRQAQKGVADVQ